MAKIYRELFSQWPDALALSRAPLAELEALIRPLGLVRRAVTLRALAEKVTTRGDIPQSAAELMELPGVGQYAARATIAAALDSDDACVDSVTARVYRRYFRLDAGLDASVDQSLWLLVRDAFRGRPARELNWAALDLAATICLPRVPRCHACPLQRDCAWAREHVRHTA